MTPKLRHGVLALIALAAVLLPPAPARAGQPFRLATQVVDDAGAMVAAADGYRAAATSSGSTTLIWVLIFFVVILGGAIAWVVIRRRRAPVTDRPQATTPSGPTVDDLTAEADALLLALDDDLRASERELRMATRQHGAEATERFRAALEASRQDVAEAFRLRVTLDEAPGPDLATLRRTLTEIIQLGKDADARLDAESEAFDELRDLEGRAAEVAAEVERRRAEITATLPAATTALQTLTSRYAGPAVTAVSANVDQATERLTFAATALSRAHATLNDKTPPGSAPPGKENGAETASTAGESGAFTATPGGDRAEAAPGDAQAAATPGGDRAEAAPGDAQAAATPGGDRAEAALAVRAAEQAVDQAEQLVAAVHEAVAAHDAARKAADTLVMEVEAEVAAGRAALTSATAAQTAASQAAGTADAAGSAGAAMAAAAAGTAAAAGAEAGALTAAMSTADQALTQARAELAGPTPDPIGVTARLQAADAALDQALADARDAAERAARARSLLAQALPVARAEVAAANSYITTRRGAVDTSARSTLAEAERHLAQAESLAAADPVTAVTKAQQAQSLAATSSRIARDDVLRFGGGQLPPVPAGDDSLFGAILGGLLTGASSGGGYRGRSHSRGSWSGGGFGGSASRSRRTGGGSGRRSAGGRF
ncbi:TPM domain-containing protein [Actinoplanes sp. NPDC049265]|uniref:TPM domain-containing protein n=1 Tax=Actinoplanes sp. NPDC049265 TaxID=3363902 RepID=UPI00372326EF